MSTTTAENIVMDNNAQQPADSAVAGLKAVNPSNQDVLGEIAYSDLKRFPDMMVKARTAQKTWQTLSFKERAVYVKRIQNYLYENAEDIAAVISADNGKTQVDALGTEVMPCIMACKWYAKHTESVLKSRIRGKGELLFINKRTSVEHLPMGVVGIISPWNYPFSIPFGEIIMALMAGNAVVLKAASATPLIAKEIDKAIAAGDLPDGLFQQIYASGGKASTAMLENGIDKLFFTGSTAVGKQLMAEAAATLTPLSLELGGNDPAIVLADADLERTANGLIWAGMQNAGQSCGGVERIYCHEAVYDELVAMLSDKISRLRHGDPTKLGSGVDIGAFTTAKQLETVKAHLKDAIDRGAKVVAQSQPVGDCENGLFHPATLLVDVPEDALTIQEETFGLLLPIMKFSNLDDAIEKANNDDMALTSSVWTKSNKTGREVSRRLQTGATMVNDHLMSHGMHQTPWGGWKGSGLGRTHGAEGLLEMTHTKTVVWDLLAPKRNLFWHPFDEATYKMLKAATSVIHKPVSLDALKGLMVLSIDGLKKMFTKF